MNRFLSRRIDTRKEEEQANLRRKKTREPRASLIRVDPAALDIVVTKPPDSDTQKRILVRDQQVTTKMRTIFENKKSGGTTMKSPKSWLKVGCMAIPAAILTIVTGYVLVRGGVWPGVISCILSFLCLTGPIATWFGLKVWQRTGGGPKVDEPPKEG